jgi:hypothetical protein
MSDVRVAPLHQRFVEFGPQPRIAADREATFCVVDAQTVGEAQPSAPSHISRPQRVALLPTWDRDVEAAPVSSRRRRSCDIRAKNPAESGTLGL